MSPYTRRTLNSSIACRNDFYNFFIAQNFHQNGDFRDVGVQNWQSSEFWKNNDRRFWNSGVISYALIPWSYPQLCNFLCIDASIVYAPKTHPRRLQRHEYRSFFPFSYRSNDVVKNLPNFALRACMKETTTVFFFLNRQTLSSIREFFTICSLHFLTFRGFQKRSDVKPG